MGIWGHVVEFPFILPILLLWTCYLILAVEKGQVQALAWLKSWVQYQPQPSLLLVSESEVVTSVVWTQCDPEPIPFSSHAQYMFPWYPFPYPLCCSKCSHFLEVSVPLSYLPHPGYMFRRKYWQRNVFTTFSLEVCLLVILTVLSQLHRSYNAEWEEYESRIGNGCGHGAITWILITQFLSAGWPPLQRCSSHGGCLEPLPCRSLPTTGTSTSWTATPVSWSCWLLLCCCSQRS